MPGTRFDRQTRHEGMLTINEKLALIRLLLRGEEREASRRGFCDRERSEIRAGLLLHGYIEKTRPADSEEEIAQEDRGSSYYMTEDGRKFLARLEERSGETGSTPIAHAQTDQ